MVENEFYDIGVNRLADMAMGFEYMQFSAGFSALPQPPRFIYGDVPGSLSKFYYSARDVWATGLYMAKDVSVFGPGLLSRGQLRFGIKETNTHIKAYETHSRLHGVNFPVISEQRISEQVVLIVGPGYDVYGHWLVDFLPKLYMLELAGIDWKKCKYLIPDTLPEFGVAWLALVGISADRLIRYPVKTGCHASNVIIPTLLRTNSRTSPLFKDAINLISRHIGCKKGSLVDIQPASKKIFVSRGKTERNRGLINRLEIEKISTELGFSIYYPEQDTLLGQVSHFSNASCCAGDYGSALHGTVFCKPNVPVCAIRWPEIEPGFLQSGVGQAMETPTGYVFGEMTWDKNRYFVSPKCIGDGLQAALALVV